jgi:cell division protein FtsI (penicillin-binding protein 3)
MNHLSSPQKRLSVLMVGLTFIFLMLTGRLWQLTVGAFDGDEVARVKAQTEQPRAVFVDRKGVLLATNIRTFSLYANPKCIPDKTQAAQKLCHLFPQLDRVAFLNRLQKNKQFVWVARHISPQTKEDVLRLGIPGLELMEDQRRIWPHGILCSEFLGLTNLDCAGISGLELGLDSQLRQASDAVSLSVDLRVQHIARDALQESINLFKAEAGNVLLIKVKTGEIIASVSLPDKDPYAKTGSQNQNLFNSNTNAVIEFGSLLKIHNTAMALDSGVSNLNSLYDASCPIRIGRFSVKDFKGKNRELTVTEAFLFSSNIANAKMALQAGSHRQRAFFEKMGFYEAVALEIPERAKPLMPKAWGVPTQITASYGYGLAVTPLHIVQSLSTMLTGIKRPLTFLKQDKPIPGKRLLKEKTVQQMRFLLHEATLNGQAKKAVVPGIHVGAKTGTANMRNARGQYVEKQNMVSCLGAFPIEDPEYVLLVTVQRPKPNALTHGYATAGWIAAPLFSNIVQRAAPLLNVFPSQTKESCEKAELFLRQDEPSGGTMIDTLLASLVSEVE